MARRQYLGVVQVCGEPSEQLQPHSVFRGVHEPLHTLQIRETATGMLRFDTAVRDGCWLVTTAARDQDREKRMTEQSKNIQKVPSTKSGRILQASVEGQSADQSGNPKPNIPNKRTTQETVQPLRGGSKTSKTCFPRHCMQYLVEVLALDALSLHFHDLVTNPDAAVRLRNAHVTSDHRRPPGM